MKSLVNYIDSIKYYLQHYSQELDFEILNITIGVDDQREMLVEVSYNVNGAFIVAQANIDWSTLKIMSENEGIGFVIQLVQADLFDKIFEQGSVTVH